MVPPEPRAQLSGPVGVGHPGAQSHREHFRHGRLNPFTGASVVLKKRTGLTPNLTSVWAHAGLLGKGERERESRREKG